MVNLLRGIFGVCVANSLLFAALIGILTAQRKKQDPPDGGGLNVTRRGRRIYVTVITCGAPEGTEDAESANNGEG